MVLDHHGRESAEEESSSHHFSFSPWTPAMPPAFRAGLHSLVNPLWKHPQIHTEVCFTNLLGISESNQVSNQD
jgi:hypothetical protein